MRALFLILALWLSPLPVAAQEQTPPAKVFNAESFTLANGLQAVVIPNHRAPVITHMVWYKTGAMDEPRGQSGIAHFVEHLMFKGTDKIPPGEFSTRIKTLGGSDNAFTGADYTAYFQTVAREHLETVMTMESDRMRGLTFPPDHVESERNVVIQERKERTDNDPRGYFLEQLRAALFVNHPYGNPVIGWLHEVDALDRNHVKSFYDTWYAPNNAVLIVSGDVTAAELKPLAEKTYGMIPRREVPVRSWTKVPPLPGLPRLTLHHAAIRQPMIHRLYRAPARVDNRQDALALEVLENILDGGAATRLYRQLVVDQKMAVSVSASYDGVAVAGGIFSVSLVPADGVALEDLEWALDETLRTLIRDGVTAQELAEAKARLKDQAVFVRDSLWDPAMIFGETLATGGTIDDLEFWPRDIDSVTASHVSDAAKRILNPDDYGMAPYVTGYLLPPVPASAESAP